MASIWEIGIKQSLGRLAPLLLVATLAAIAVEQDGFKLLPVEVQHVAAMTVLPSLHRDPFDRMIVAQAITERMTLISADRDIRRYPVTVVW